MHVTESRVRVRYKETDQMGIAHHSNYLVWFEMGRTDLCRKAGVSYRQIEETGYLLVVTDISCRYRIPFRYDDEVVIQTRVAEVGSRILQFAYELRNAAGDLCASGVTRHLWLDRDTRRPVKSPRELEEKFRQLVKPNQ